MINKKYQVKKTPGNAKFLGNLGEQIAKKFLLQHGYKLLDANYFIQGGEIDIVAEMDDIIVFVEVKARTNNAFGKAAMALTPFKKHKLMKAIYSYLTEKRLLLKKWRLDAICIDLRLDSRRAFVQHFQNIFVQ